MKRGVGVALALVLAIAVVAAVVLGQKMGGGAKASPTVGAAGSSAAAVKHVKGVVGSEKEAFFRDPAVKAAFARHGLDVTVTPAGSRDIATLPDIASQDFVFPSSAPAADKIRRTTKVKGAYSPFYSPIAVASFQPIVDLLAQQKVAKKGPGGVWLLDMRAYQALASKGVRWDRLPGNSVYPASKNVLVTTTDVRRSNSAAMYLSLMSYVANGDTVVTAGANASQMVPKVAPLFLDQGYLNGSTEAPFEDYLALGMGKTPMVLIYESQFLDREMRKDGSITKDMVLMYPTPDVLSKHTLLGISDEGATVGDLLTSDADLVRLEARYGFRTQQRAVFTKTLQDAGVTPPPDLVDVIEPPTFEALEQLITGIEKLYG